MTPPAISCPNCGIENGFGDARCAICGVTLRGKRRRILGSVGVAVLLVAALLAWAT
jgi:hypothetical protein